VQLHEENHKFSMPLVLRSRVSVDLKLVKMDLHGNAMLRSAVSSLT